MDKSSRAWVKAVRTVLLATALGALVGIVAGAESADQRLIIMGLAAGVGLVAGVALALIPREREIHRRDHQTFSRDPKGSASTDSPQRHREHGEERKQAGGNTE